MIDAGPTLISYVGADGRYRRVNRAYERWFGLPAEEVRGRYVRDLLGEEAWRRIQPYVERALAGEVVVYEQELPLRDGGPHWLHTTYTPDPDESGRIRGFVVHAVEVGECKRVEETLLKEKAFSESVINSMPGVFYLFTSQGKFLRWNRNLEEVSGYLSQEIAHMTPLDFFSPEEKGVIANAIGRVFTEGHVSVEAKLVSKSGREVPYYFIGRRMFIDGVPHLIGSGVDMSGRKEAQETQRATLNILEDFDEERRKFQLTQKATLNLLEDFDGEKAKLQRLQQATMNLLEDFDEERRNFQRVQKATLNLLEDMNEERAKLNDTQLALMNLLEDAEMERVKAEQARALLEAVNRELEAFSYSVSHDLRAPLRAISGFAQAVVEDYSPRLDDEGKRFLGLIQDNAHRMGQLIDDLLTFSRLGRQQLMETQIDLGALANGVFEELIAQTPGRKIRFTTRSVPPALGDKAMIRQVLMNLLANAIKFTRPRAEAVIEFGYLPELEGGAYFVKDDGVGFDMQYVDKLFGVFQRLHSAAEFEGTGVGLAIVYRIITRHGGRVWAEGRVDQGATFYFTLPEG
jgi:PAS domain S-box-containing protein